jgi:N-acetylmuramoyl-L-alanine amidase
MALIGSHQAKADKELDCFTVAIYRESGGESLYGQIAVGWVILNRLNSKRFGSSICAIVYSKEFSFNHKNERPIVDWRRRKDFAKLIFDKHFVDPTKGALFFQNLKAKRWAKKPCNILIIGNHKFFNVCK